MCDDTLSFIPTKASLLKNDSPKRDFQSSTFTSYKSKGKRKLQPSETLEEEEEEEEKSSKEFNMKKARHEILKFGMSGFDATKKQEAKIQLAIKLGAKPPKNKYKNYKDLLQEKAKEKQEIEQHVEFQQLGKNKLGKSTAKSKHFDKKKRKNNGGILDVYGTVVAS